MTRRSLLQSTMALAAGVGRSASASTLPEPEVAELSVPLAGAGGRIERRYRAFAGRIRIDIGEGHFLDMACIPDGTGLRGSERRTYSWSILSGLPIRPVRIRSLLLAAVPITKEQWLRVVRLPQVSRELWIPFQMPLRRPGEERWPVEDFVSFLQAEEFAARLRRFTGLPFRLPSETEWEYASRAGTTTWYNYGEERGPDIWTERFQPVGSKNAPNRFGLFEMHDWFNWCADFSHTTYTSVPVDGSPAGPGDRNRDFRILRGRDGGSAGRSDFIVGGSHTLMTLRLAITHPHGIRDVRLDFLRHHVTDVGDAFSPGQLLRLEGENVGPATRAEAPTDADGVPLELNGVSVYFDELRAPVVSCSESSVVVFVPMRIPTDGRLIDIVVRNGFQSAMPLRAVARAAAPAVFEVEPQQADVRNEDGERNGPERPARPGSKIEFRANGLGVLSSGEVSDGAFVTQRGIRPEGSVRVEVGGRECVIESCEQELGAPLGIVRLVVRLSEDLAAGQQGLLLQVGEARSKEGLSLFVGVR